MIRPSGQRLPTLPSPSRKSTSRLPESNSEYHHGDVISFSQPLTRPSPTQSWCNNHRRSPEVCPNRTRIHYCQRTPKHDH
jgi:hypothetical protein